MPSRTTPRAETKYNVPHLGLHSAAANRNVGLASLFMDSAAPLNSLESPFGIHDPRPTNVLDQRLLPTDIESRWEFKSPTQLD